MLNVAVILQGNIHQSLCFRLHQGPNFLCLSTCVFRFYYFFDSFLLSTQEKNRKTVILSKRLRSFNYALLFLVIQQNTVRFFSFSIRNYNAMASEIQTKDNLRRKMFGEILERLLSRLLSRFKDFWLEHFPKINNRRGVE